MQQNYEQFDLQDVEKTRGLSCLSYIGILFLIPLLVNGNSPYTKFHINQGIILLIVDVIAGVSCFILRFIPFIGGLLAGLISLGLLALMIYGIVNAASGRAIRLPVIGMFDLYK